jgi:hypothetical protein
VKSFCYLDWHLGLGDIIVCNAIVREKAMKYDHVLVPCYMHNEDSVRAMFRDVGNLAAYFVFEDGSGDMFHPEKILRGEVAMEAIDVVCLNASNPEWHTQPDSFDKKFYRLAGIPFEQRWSGFHAPCENQLPIPEEPFVLVHDDAPRGYAATRFNADKYPKDWIIIPVHKVSKSITDWIQRIEYAEEIHCINSAFLHLVESLYPTGKLVYHRYARDDGLMHQPDMRHPWNIID